MEAPKLELTPANITRARNQVLSTLSFVKELTNQSGAPVVQEMILAQRDLENARMRLGVARTYLEEKNPFEVEHLSEED